MDKKKVFISFDFDNDKALKDLLIGQALNPACPFEVIDTSLKEAAPEKDWEVKAKTKIRVADLVIVLVGANTYRASGVLREVRLARREKKKVVQLIGHKDGRHPRVPDAGILYRWTWENMQKILC
ncbi:MAG TPA: TIR domain-containing protein [Puia sp.]|nr:TIR domain-containing protein [Puia sp.]